MSDKDILQFFIDAEDPVLGTGDIADFLDFSNRGARERLYKLSDKGLVDYRKLGRVPAWWITERGRAYLAGELDASEIED
ncbi:hypothetical protein ACFSUP_04355 [Gracilibacillus thailandensis]|uniref:hypothetical protein n=1 Tax=Gracilibacillus thailandensis TaxID=563735 RepID=UPI00362EAC3C